jgi:regulator of protease activity HflC (stomatin/prohibitin superfamily)
MEAAFSWIGDLFCWLSEWFPRWIQVDVNEQAIKHKGWWRRRTKLVKPGIRWYWPAFSQVEGPFRVVWQPLTTSTINVMDKAEVPVAARGFAIWRIVDLHKFVVENEDASAMLDDLVCAAIREVITAKVLAEIQGNSRRTTDNALLREVKDLTEDLGVEIQLVRLTTFTSTKVFSLLGDEPPAVVQDDEPDEE